MLATRALAIALAGNDDVDVRDVAGPRLQRTQTQVMLVDRLDIGVSPADGGLEALLAQESDRLERTGPAASVQQ